MASTEELVEAIYRLIASSPTPIPVTLMNHGVDETAAIIGAVVEHCARNNIALTEIFIDPDLAELLGLVERRTAAARVQADVRCDAGLGCHVRFQKARTRAVVTTRSGKEQLNTDGSVIFREKILVQSL